MLQGLMCCSDWSWAAVCAPWLDCFNSSVMAQEIAVVQAYWRLLINTAQDPLFTRSSQKSFRNRTSDPPDFTGAATAWWMHPHQFNDADPTDASCHPCLCRRTSGRFLACNWFFSRGEHFDSGLLFSRRRLRGCDSLGPPLAGSRERWNQGCMSDSRRYWLMYLRF